MQMRFAVAMALGVAGLVLLPVLAHEGHVKAAPNAFDPNAPRRPSAATAAAIGLKTAEVAFGPIESVVRLGGTVRARPDRRAAIAAPVGGMLTSMPVQPGDMVKRGDVIAVLNSAELAQMVHEQLKTEVEYEHAQSEAVSTKASLNTLRAQIASAERQAELAEQEVARMRAGADAVGANVLAQREAVAIQTRSQADGLKMTLEQQTKEWKSLEKRAEASGKAAAALGNVIAIVESGMSGGVREEGDAVGVVRLRAPLDGVVVRRVGIVGQGVVSGQTLAEVADYSSVQVDGELPESLVGKMDVFSADGGRTARIRRTVDGPEIGAGRVRPASPVIDPVKRTAHLVVDAENAGGLLRDGMYVDLSIVVKSEKNAVVVPAAAVVSDGPLRFVFIKEKDAFVKRDVRVGAGDDRVVEILEGVVPGDEVVVKGAYAVSQLRPGG